MLRERCQVEEEAATTDAEEASKCAVRAWFLVVDDDGEPPASVLEAAPPVKRSNALKDPAEVEKRVEAKRAATASSLLAHNLRALERYTQELSAPSSTSDDVVEPLGAPIRVVHECSSERAMMMRSSSMETNGQPRKRKQPEESDVPKKKANPPADVANHCECASCAQRNFCGSCLFCRDKLRFNGANKIRKKCAQLLPCFRPLYGTEFSRHGKRWRIRDLAFDLVKFDFEVVYNEAHAPSSTSPSLASSSTTTTSPNKFQSSFLADLVEAGLITLPKPPPPRLQSPAFDPTL